jgi:hypothetical protein
MRIAVSGRSLAAAHFRPELLHLRDLIDVWQTDGHEVILIRPPGAVDDQAGDVRRVYLGQGSPVRMRPLFLPKRKATSEVSSNRLCHL